MTWNDNAYFAPEALVDDRGRQIMWAWIFDDRPDSLKNMFGWTGTYGLPRSLWVAEDGTLGMAPVKELEQLRLNERQETNLQVEAGEEVSMDHLGHELMELEININPIDAKEFGVKICVSENRAEETLIYYDGEEKMLKVDTRKSSLAYGRKIVEEAPLELKEGEPLRLNIFIDKSIVEVFANDRQAIARMVYPTLKGKGMYLFSKGGKVEVPIIKSWELMPSNPY
jgi:beta-fructofuranosidase